MASSVHTEPTFKKTFSSLLKLNKQIAADVQMVFFHERTFNIDITSDGYRLCGKEMHSKFSFPEVEDDHPLGSFQFSRIRNFHLWIHVDLADPLSATGQRRNGPLEDEEMLKLQEKVRLVVYQLEVTSRIRRLDVTVVIERHRALGGTYLGEAVAAAQTFLAPLWSLRNVERPYVHNIIQTPRPFCYGSLPVSSSSNDSISWPHYFEIGRLPQLFKAMTFRGALEFACLQSIFPKLLSAHAPTPPSISIPRARYMRLALIAKSLTTPRAGGSCTDLRLLDATLRIARDLNDALITSAVRDALAVGHTTHQINETERQGELNNMLQRDRDGGYKYFCGDFYPRPKEVRFCAKYRYADVAEVAAKFNIERYWVTLDGCVVFQLVERDSGKRGDWMNVMRFTPRFVSSLLFRPVSEGTI